MNDKNVIELLNHIQNNLILLAITRNVNRIIQFKEKDSQEQLDKEVFNYQNSSHENYYAYFVDESQLDYFIEEIPRICYSFQNKIVFVIFNEYFFGKEPLNKIAFDALCSKFNELALKMPNVHIFFFINILIEEEKNDINVDEMALYSDTFTINDFCFNATNGKKINYEKGKKFYSNTTFIIYMGRPIIKYSKSSFANEKFKNNYKFGFGNIDILLNNDISKKIFELVDIYICMDLTVRPYYELITNIDFSFSTDIMQVEKLDKLREVLKEHNKNFTKKKIIIVQSNTIELSSNLFNFENNTIIIQVDPQTTFTIQINYNEFFKKYYLDFKERYNRTKDYITKKYYQNENIKKSELFKNEFNFFNYKRRIYQLNNVGISTKIDSIINFTKQDDIFLCQYNVFSLKDIII